MRPLRAFGGGALFGSVLVCTALAAGEPSGTGSPPPSDLERHATHATLYFRHTHRIVNACNVERKEGVPRCDSLSTPGDVRTELRLVPVSDGPKRSKSDQRTPARVPIGRDGTSGPDGVELVPGKWELSWQGYAGGKSFVLEAGNIARVALETTTGRCESRSRVCALDRRVTVRTVDVEIR